MSDCVGSAISRSGTVENVVVAVGIFSPSLSVQRLFPLPVSWPTCGVRMPADVGPYRSAIPRSGMIENVRVAIDVSFVAVTQAYSYLVIG